jgi:ADP-heptose:LPS heptosyltransferase
MINLLKKIINKFLSANKIFILYRLGNAIGDQLLMTGVAKLIKKKYNYNIIILTKFPELFENNPNIYKTYKITTQSFFSNIFVKLLKKINSDFIKEFMHESADKKIFNLKNYQSIHIANYHSLNLNLNLKFKNYKNEIFFSDKEHKFFKENLNLPCKFALIQSQSKTSFTPNREWGLQNFQKIVDSTPQINWIQIGKKTDTQIRNTYSFYTKFNLRELAYIIYRSRLLLCLEGFYYHLANSFRTKKILIMSGFMSVKNIYYKNNNNIIVKNIDNLKCYPCYKLYKCDIPNKPCTNLISYKFVLKKVLKNYS